MIDSMLGKDAMSYLLGFIQNLDVTEASIANLLEFVCLPSLSIF